MPNVAPISQQIWDMKYRLKAPDGTAVDKTIEDSWRRIAEALAQPEADKARWAKRFCRIMEDFKFLPAGRVVAGAGSGRNVTLFNCFVMWAFYPRSFARIIACSFITLPSFFQLMR